MRTSEIIIKKRDGLENTQKEIDFMVKGYCDETIPDYQMAAWLMAIYFKGMSLNETLYLTESMVKSGRVIDLSGIKGIKVDKHSTGGVGDKVTIVLTPLVASLGVKMAKLSGRGLGHTGGTLDKLESIPGFNTNLSIKKFIETVNKVGIGIIGQTEDIVPADKKIYALRDVTGATACIPLIASSIMSKKIAGGADAIILDIKAGSGAFMKTTEEAMKLAEILVYIGKKMKRRVTAVISDMSQPLGYSIGNAIEIKEAIETLRGKGPSDLTKLCLTLGAHILILAGIVNKKEDGIEELKNSIKSGAALKKFCEWIEAQGGNSKIVDNLSLLPEAKYVFEVKSKSKGYIYNIDTQKIGECAMILGAGRETKESPIDYSAGIKPTKKAGEFIRNGEVLAFLYTNNKQSGEEVSSKFFDVLNIKNDKPKKKPLIYKEIYSTTIC